MTIISSNESSQKTVSDQSIVPSTHLATLKRWTTLTMLLTGVVFIISLWVVLTPAYAQDPQIELFDAHVESMQTGMTILGGWAMTNLLVGGVARQYSSGYLRYFHEMNAGWNVVNLGIAAIGYYALPDVTSWTALEGVSELNKIDRILLFNAGLDLGYMALGYGLIERGRRLDSERYIGYGRSLLLPGGFLFLFDSIFAYLHSDLTAKLTMQLVPNGSGLSLNMLF